MQPCRNLTLIRYNCRMFERYTESARRTILFAKQWASSFGSSQISSEHLLSGIMADEDLATYLLRPASLEQMVFQIKQERSCGQEMPSDADAPLSDEAKSILKLSAAEADDLHDKHIGNEHLLLAVLEESKCYAARLLTSKGVSLLTLRERIASLRKDPSLVARTGQRRFLPKDVTRAELGIPEGYAPRRLLFNPPSETMILELQGLGDISNWRPTRLYLKHKNAAKYSQIGSPDETTSYESPVTSLKQPLLGFNVMTWQKNESSVAGNWQECRVLDINSGVLQHSVKNGEPILPEGFNDCWISDLLAISDDGGQIYVIAGVSFRGENVGRSRIRHVLGVLDLTSKRLDPISVLRGVFF